MKDKQRGIRLMGFGHRVYKNYDPRAAVMQKTAKEVLEQLGADNLNPTLQVARELERIALSDEYFIQRKLYPNVDFYSGIVLEAIGFPTSMFTAIFALARTVGWIAQWKEMIGDPQKKIGRPAPALQRRRRCATTCRSDSARASANGRHARARAPRDRPAARPAALTPSPRGSRGSPRAARRPSLARRAARAAAR